MATLDKAIRIAAEVHGGQKDRYEAPYMLHPIRVMMRVSGEQQRIVAILHDVVEDSDWTLDDLRQQEFAEEIVEAVDCLTKREGEPYMDYISRLEADQIARAVKLADLEDNMDMRRLDKFSDKDADRFGRYHKAWWRLKRYD
ncbi:GTP pyrophosphokinase [candidate division KSB1 bacterium]|nr:GTP pyrophosphokinase [candidate division KSB1 bacterium]NIR69561.1 GTP pyrophosphokinase [candidate division KSB1 bacterium]NIS25909.1 GTP pyrophosphokinase [candidate division KSB1 bacterium]NIT72790.1 GTP pyrophosphokinase [candidate division KSB1 bacterium]NIU26597.1 GTP pyrophosphokinase [candidate division KSB1 bacterium]